MVHPELDAMTARAPEVVAAFRNLGFVYVTLDMEGFRSGSMNEVLSISTKKGEQP